LVTTNPRQNARVTIWGFSVKITPKSAKFVLKNGIVSLVGLFTNFQLSGGK